MLFRVARMNQSKRECDVAINQLVKELQVARTKVVTDGYEMSLGEVASMYRAQELVIDPNYQRLYRWTDSQRTRFVESLLLGIPIPPIFVFQRETGVWELIDGLQRMSTVLQLMGELKLPDGNGLYPQLELAGTNLLPALDGMKWKQAHANDDLAFDSSLQLELRRARVRVEILKKESDEVAKFELFQRLNTGGSKLSEQEVRNSILVMLNLDLYSWLAERSQAVDFKSTVPLTVAQVDQQQGMEIALRFFAYRLHPYKSGLDVNEYLDYAARKLSVPGSFDLTQERDTFNWVFGELNRLLGDGAFKKWDGGRHLGPFTISAFDAIAYGLAVNKAAIENIVPAMRDQWIVDKVKGLWGDRTYQANSGSGVRGTTRLMNLLPWAEVYFRP